MVNRADQDPAEIEYSLGTRLDGLSGRHQQVAVFVGPKGQTKQQAGVLRLTGAEHTRLQDLLKAAQA